MVKRPNEPLCKTLAEWHVMAIASNRMLRDRAIAEARIYKFGDLRQRMVSMARRLNTDIIKDRTALRTLRSAS